jgi:PKD repeat protein
MTKQINLIVVLIMGLSSLMFAQNSSEENCGWYDAQESFFDTHPGSRESSEILDKEFLAFAQQFSMANKFTPDTVIIPIVFHVIHNNGPENVSNEEIYGAVDRLNIDFMANNTDLDDIAEDFVDIIGNPTIQFKLAQYDPQGNCSNGITRHVSQLTYVGDDQVKNIVHWGRASYLNVWITSVVLNGNAGGYSYYPGSVNFSPGDDGIVIRAAQFGYNRRDLTHEVGHWLNLPHTWGNSNEPGLSSNCSIDDFSGSDTPNTIGHSGGCSLTSTSCGSLDNIQNYMDYSSCPKMFTEGQSTRMIAALNSSTSQRNQLWTTSNLNDTGVNENPILCTANFEADDVRICSGTTVEFTNLSFNGDTEWTWEFEGGDPATSTAENPEVVYTTPGLFQVSLTIGNGVDEMTETKTEFVHVLPDAGMTTPIEEGFENVDAFPNEDWIIFSTDVDRYWEVTSAASSSGNNSAVLKNYYQDEGNKDILESNPIDLSDLNDVVISFKYSYAKRHNDDNDVLRLKVTKNCGLTWITKKTLKATNGTLPTAPNHIGYFTPESSEWDIAYVDNISSIYLIDNFRFKFEFTAGGGNNVYVDDINIYDPATVGINEVNKDALQYQVFPNPIENTLNLSFNVLHRTDVVGEVYDISGRKVQTLFNQSFAVGVNTMEINTSDWNAGMYFVRISLEEETFIEKVIKK